jgi:hypothetical protein
MVGACSNCGEGEVSIGFWYLYLKERDHMEDTGLDWRIILLRWTARKWDVRA